MMLSGNMGGGDRGGGKMPSEREKLQFSACDLSSDDFKKTWLILKELHDKELRRLQAKLTSMRKERLVDGRRTGSIAKIKELTEQQKVLSDTINDLREQLKAKTCDRCLINETYRNTLQQEFYDIQQQNLKFIAELTAERNKLREENKKLSARLKSNQEKIHVSFTDSDDDFIPCSQRTMPAFSTREPIQGTQMPAPMKLLKQSHVELMKSEGRKELQKSPKFSPPFYSQDLFEVPETSFEKTSSNGNKPSTEDSLHQIWGFPSTSQRVYGFQGVSNVPEDKVGQPKRKHEMKTSTQKTSTQKRETRLDFSWSLSSISSGDKLTTQVVSETSEENMPGYNRNIIPSCTQRKERLPLNVFPFDYTLRSSGKRSTFGTAHYNIGFEVRDDIDQTPFKEKCALKKNTNESTSTGYGDDKPQDDTESPFVGSTLKRKARMQSEKKRK